MIQMSLSRLAPVLALVLPLASCWQSCPADACLEGLTISLSGGFDPDTAYDIELSRPTGSGGATPVMSCTLTVPLDRGAEMTCTSTLHFQADPRLIRLPDERIPKLRVVISAGGGVVAQRDYDVNYPGSSSSCGSCTRAYVDVDFPVRPVWGTQGRSLEGGCRSDALGAVGFVATRDELSPDQLALLSMAQALPDPAATCSDGRPDGQMSCYARVRYFDGAVVDWYAQADDGQCFAGLPEKGISFTTFDPFRQTLSCRYSHELTPLASAAAAGTGPLPVLAPSPICKHGLTATAGTTVKVGVEVPAAPASEASRPRHLEVTCNPTPASGRIAMQLFDAAGALLESGVDPHDPTTSTCQTIDVTFPAPGTYVVGLAVPPTYFTGNVFLTYR